MTISLEISMKKLVRLVAHTFGCSLLHPRACARVESVLMFGLHLFFARHLVAKLAELDTKLL